MEFNDLEKAGIPITADKLFHLLPYHSREDSRFQGRPRHR